MITFRHVIITGGSSGIGKAAAKIYAQTGAEVSIVARSPERLAEAQAEIEASRGAAQGQTRTYPADVADQAMIENAIGRAIGDAGPPDLLITSAGIVEPGYFTNLPNGSFERQMAVNYFGTLYAVKAVLPAMRDEGRGRIVLVSSGAGLIGIFGYTAYCPTKFALRGLAESLRGELKRDGIGVSIVYPPDTDTPQLHEENKTKPPETKLITDNAKVWSAEGVARTIHDGIERGRFAITPGWEMTWLARLNSLIRPLIDWQFDRLAKKMWAKSAKPD
jgi:3-dehydrosphinganine reductase